MPGNSMWAAPLTTFGQLTASARRFVQYPSDLQAAVQSAVGGFGAAHTILPTWTTRSSCQCPKIGSHLKQRHMKAGAFKFLSSTKSRHLPSCPLSRQVEYEKTRSFSFSVLPFLAGTVELFSAFHLDQRLSSFSIRYYPTVQRTSSPAFGLFNGVFDHFLHTGQIFGLGGDIHGVLWGLLPATPTSRPSERVQLSLKQLPARLDAMLAAGNALPSEKDEFGNTLLFVSHKSMRCNYVTSLTVRAGVIIHLPISLADSRDVAVASPRCQRCRDTPS